MSPQLDEFKLVGGSYELAIICEDNGQEFVSIIEQPHITEVMFEAPASIPVMNGKPVQQEPARVTLEVTGYAREHITGRNASEAAPDLVEDMTVGELLDIVNKKLAERGEE